MEIPVKIFPAKLITSVVALVKKTGSTWIYMDLMFFLGSRWFAAMGLTVTCCNLVCVKTGYTIKM